MRIKWDGVNPKPSGGLLEYGVIVDEFVKENGDMKVQPKYVSYKEFSNLIDSEKEKAKMQYNKCTSFYMSKSEITDVFFPKIEKVHFSGPCTVVIWDDGTKTVVRCQDGDEFDCEKGLAMAIAKKALGNKGSYFDEFKKHMPQISPSEVCKERIGAWSSLFQFATIQETISKLEETISLLKKETKERD